MEKVTMKQPFGSNKFYQLVKKVVEKQKGKFCGYSLIDGVLKEQGLTRDKISMKEFNKLYVYINWSLRMMEESKVIKFVAWEKGQSVIKKKMYKVVR